MKLAAIGSRTFSNRELVFLFVQSLPKIGSSSPGGAPGPDSWAVEAATDAGLRTKVFPADWASLGRRAGFARNAQIAQHCDVLVAFWDGVSRGTMDTVRTAAKLGRPFRVILASDPAVWPTFDTGLVCPAPNRS